MNFQTLSINFQIVLWVNFEIIAILCQLTSKGFTCYLQIGDWNNENFQNNFPINSKLNHEFP